MNYNLGYDYDYGVASSTSVWTIVAFILAIIGGIVLYFTVFSKQNEKKYKGFMAWLYDFVTFKKLMLETILKVLYIVTALFITLSSFALVSVNFVTFLLYLIVGNVLARIVYEFSLLMITICKNTTEMNKKLDNLKKEEK